MTRVAVVVHSERGACRALAAAVLDGVCSVDGAEGVRIDVPEVSWDVLAAADAIVFGCPTYMGSASGPFKAFLDESSSRAWAAGAWRDKLAAGFTSSASPSGDKLLTLQQLAVVAAQHGMVWVGLDLLPGEPNRLGSNLGAMAWTPIGSAPDPADLRCARRLGQRVARAALRWTGRASRTTGTHPHPTARDWALPPAERPEIGLPRVNLRAMMARPERFEHHLVPVARVGDAQLEIVTASEPLAFAHLNRSDEYALSLPTGDPLTAALPLLTLLTDPATGEDAGRVKHREGDLVLHPHGWLHWPGRLRPPYVPFAFPPGTRRCGLSLVLAAATEIGPGARPIPAGPDCKSYGPDVPLGVARVTDGPLGPVAEVAGAELAVVEGDVAPTRGGWLVVLAPGAAPVHEGDLVRIPAGGRLDGVGRGLLLAHPDREPDPPPPSWERLPEPVFAPFEDGSPGALPIEVAGVRVEAVDAATARVIVGDRSAEVPRYWAARMLFRVGLHGLWLGYLETYGGLFWDDRGGYRLGVRGAAAALDPRTAAATIEALYLAIAPPGYTERPPS
jgi:multimeric flavodoxin WrbA